MTNSQMTLLVAYAMLSRTVKQGKMIMCKKFGLQTIFACTFLLTQSQNLLAADLTFTTLAGKSGAIVNSADGTGSAAQFSAPRGVALDSEGNLYVADASNHTIRKVTSTGVVTTVAGTAGTAGVTADTPAKFHEPFGVAVDGAGTIYVADTNNGAIRKISPAGVVTTLAGGNGVGYADGTGLAAKFKEPHGIAVDSTGNLYVADYENNVVRKVTATGVVTTLAGTYKVTGTADGEGAAARFMLLQGIAVDSAGNVYVADGGARTIRKITPSGVVTTLAGASTGVRFGEPRGVAVDASGSALYVTDYTANVILKVTLPAGVVSTVAGTSPTAGSTDGTTTTALFNAPSSIAVDSANNLYVADTANNTVRKISAAGTVSTLAGLAERSSSVDGNGTAARFEEPYAIATDGTYVYVADHTDHSIRKIAADGTVTTLAGKAGSYGSADGTGAAARFKAPTSIAVDSAGTVYVADNGNSTVRKITAAGVVTTLAGTAGSKGNLDATGAAARFSAPSGVAVDKDGNVFVVDSEASTLRKITAVGVVTTLAGNANSNGFINGTGTAARFAVPFDVAVDQDGNLYITDRNNHAIRKVTASGVVTTLAGSGSPGYANGSGSAAMFTFPSGITVDGAGVVYVADTDNQVIRKITPTGDVTTFAGSSIGSTDGPAASTKFWNPKDVAVDANGNMFVADRGNYTVRKGSASATTISVAVAAGWSLLGNSSTAVLTVADPTLLGDSSKVTSVWKWISNSSKWAFYTPTQTDSGAAYASSKGYETLTTINAGEGFWVNATAAFSFSLPLGGPVQSTSFKPAVSNPATAGGAYALKSGWNLISAGDNPTPTQFDAAIATVLSSPPTAGNVYTNLATMWAWNATAQKWYMWAPKLVNSGLLGSYLNSNSYLDFADMPTTPSGTISPTTGLWVNVP